MAKYRLTYLVLPLALLALASCSQEAPEIRSGADGDRISFVASVPGASSRTTYNIIEQIQSSGITVSAISPEAPAGPLDVFFQDVIVSLDVDGAFRGDSCRWPANIAKEGQLRFFAFHPSRAEMKSCAGVGNQCFVYSNSSKKDDSSISYDFRLNKFRVAPDISRQVDFVTAIAEGNKTDHLYSGVDLYFEHQLCGVEIGVWGGATLYDVEVAGVRIGGTVIEADFSLSATVDRKPDTEENSIGAWLITPHSTRGHVDYVFTPGDKVVQINNSSHNTADKAASIMGKGGKAMVIPYRHDKWDYKNDRTNDDKGMYFSALIRMTQRDGDHHVIFPSTDPQSRSSLVFLLVRKSDGMVMRRLSSSEYDNFSAPDGQEKRAYGWAAAPVNVDWKAGYTYSYVLDYTTGVGVHDPADSNPATAIIDWDGGVEIIPYTPYGGQWGDGEIITIGNGSWGANSNNTAPDGTVWWK